MTTHYTCLECNVSFEAKDALPLHKAINEIPGGARNNTLEEAFREYGFTLVADNEVLSLEPADGYVRRDWDAFFAAIAPYAAPESLFALIDDDTNFYGWRVREGAAREVRVQMEWVEVDVESAPKPPTQGASPEDALVESLVRWMDAGCSSLDTEAPE